jgi:exopolysaccharide biosynthesis polyprenyl glycosylphosphotransferase
MSTSAEAVAPSGEMRGLAARQRIARQRVKTREWRILIAALVVNDLVMTGVAFRLAYWIRFEIGLPVFVFEALSSRAYYEQVALILVPLWLLIFALVGLYQRDNLLGGTEEYARVFRGTTLGLMLVVVIGFLDPTLIIARGWIVAGWPLAFAAIAAGRMALRRVVYRSRSRGHFMSRAVIIGANEEARLLARQLQQWSTSGLDLVGFVDGAQAVGEELAPNLRVLDTLEHLDSVIQRHEVEEIILASSALTREVTLDLFRRYGVTPGLQVRMSSGLYEIITTGLSVKEFAYVPLVGVDRVRLKGADWASKTILDYLLTVPVLILLSPLLATIALLIKLGSPGPVIHRRRVMGINGSRFDAFKFRTMYAHGDEILAAHPELQQSLAQEHKLKDDPRVTPIGRVLRRYSLDELPQLLNVLRREMSLVGPRMISPEEMPRYEQWGMNLLTIPPGITGLWQVSGRSDISYGDRVRLDMHYIRNWTIWFDLQLLWQTIPVVLRGRGAY